MHRSVSGLAKNGPYLDIFLRKRFQGRTLRRVEHDICVVGVLCQSSRVKANFTPDTLRVLSYLIQQSGSRERDVKRARASGEGGQKICHCWVALFNVMVRFSNIRDNFSETKKPAGRISNILCSHKWCWSITQNIWTMPRARNTEKEQ